MPNDSSRSVEISADGMTVISNMTDAIHHVRHAIGEKDPAYVKMVESFAHSIAQMIKLGGRVTSDGSRSLYCRNGFIDYGVNFHSMTHPDPSIADFHMVKDNLGTWSVNS